MGARLLEERERACDEEVLEMGSEPQVYAESILKACEFCGGSSAGVRIGSNGRRSQETDCADHVRARGREIGSWQKLLLLTICSTAVAVPDVMGLVNSPPRILRQLQEADGPAVQPLRWPQLSRVAPETIWFNSSCLTGSSRQGPKH